MVERSALDGGEGGKAISPKSFRERPNIFRLGNGLGITIPPLVQFQGKYLDLLKLSQQEAYGEEINKLRKGKQLPTSSSLFPLTPKLDRKGNCCPPWI